MGFVRVAKLPRDGVAEQVVRNVIGAADRLQAAPGAVRADFALSTRENLVHGSDSEESARREIAVFFKKSEIF